MKSSYLCLVIVLFSSVLASCGTVYQPTVAQQPYYAMSTNTSGQAVFAPIAGTGSTTTATTSSSCCSLCSWFSSSSCATSNSVSQAAAYTTTPTGNAYKVGSYPAYYDYNSPYMPAYGTYYYKMGPSR
ncbi:MAG: hypothetical protein HKM04_00010 [Legionellales bacterium]|nr:hypothetical protein [Legionellales bacterium]